MRRTLLFALVSVAVMACLLASVTAQTKCGSAAGGKPCMAGECCSKFGWCGKGAEFCGSGCQSGVCDLQQLGGVKTTMLGEPAADVEEEQTTFETAPAVDPRLAKIFNAFASKGKAEFEDKVKKANKAKNEAQTGDSILDRIFNEYVINGHAAIKKHLDKLDGKVGDESAKAASSSVKSTERKGDAFGANGKHPTSTGDPKLDRLFNAFAKKGKADFEAQNGHPKSSGDKKLDRLFNKFAKEGREQFDKTHRTAMKRATQAPNGAVEPKLMNLFNQFAEDGKSAFDAEQAKEKMPTDVVNPPWCKTAGPVAQQKSNDGTRKMANTLATDMRKQTKKINDGIIQTVAEAKDSIMDAAATVGPEGRMETRSGGRVISHEADSETKGNEGATQRGTDRTIHEIDSAEEVVFADGEEQNSKFQRQVLDTHKAERTRGGVRRAMQGERAAVKSAEARMRREEKREGMSSVEKLVQGEATKVTKRLKQEKRQGLTRDMWENAEEKTREIFAGQEEKVRVKRLEDEVHRNERAKAEDRENMDELDNAVIEEERSLEDQGEADEFQEDTGDKLTAHNWKQFGLSTSRMLDDTRHMAKGVTQLTRRLSTKVADDFEKAVRIASGKANTAQLSGRLRGRDATIRGNTGLYGNIGAQARAGAMADRDAADSQNNARRDIFVDSQERKGLSALRGAQRKAGKAGRFELERVTSLERHDVGGQLNRVIDAMGQDDELNDGRRYDDEVARDARTRHETLQMAADAQNRDVAAFGTQERHGAVRAEDELIDHERADNKNVDQGLVSYGQSQAKMADGVNGLILGAGSQGSTVTQLITGEGPSTAQGGQAEVWGKDQVQHMDQKEAHEEKSKARVEHKKPREEHKEEHKKPRKKPKNKANQKTMQTNMQNTQKWVAGNMQNTQKWVAGNMQKNMKATKKLMQANQKNTQKVLGKILGGGG